ncbi:MAG TPA: IclR family transcriptional regulator C-terminal domain-containing protein [Candidimonas sp.]|nr:IclR family transcriptional regulator C-terminal domain-containing protein [Candidimonas sp.]
MYESGPKTFRRGLQIIEALRAAGDEGLKITDIAGLTGIQRTTIYRFLDVLVDQRYVHPPTDDRVFIFNHAHFTRGSAAAYSIDRLKPVLARISAQTGDSSFLVRRENGDSLCVHREVGTYPVQVLSVTIGYRQPLGVGAAGLALLANLPKDDIQQILRANKNILPKFGGMTCEQMEQLIKSTLERGWSAVGNSAVPGVLGVGVPILHRSGHPIFAISVSSVIDRMPLKRQRFIVELIKKELALAAMC